MDVFKRSILCSIMTLCKTRSHGVYVEENLYSRIIFCAIWLVKAAVAMFRLYYDYFRKLMFRFPHQMGNRIKLSWKSCLAERQSYKIAIIHRMYYMSNNIQPIKITASIFSIIFHLLQRYTSIWLLNMILCKRGDV